MDLDAEVFDPILVKPMDSSIEFVCFDHQTGVTASVPGFGPLEDFEGKATKIIIGESMRPALVDAAGGQPDQFLVKASRRCEVLGVE